MKALSIREPWATAVVMGWKDIENRSWSTTYRGPLLIHAAATVLSRAAMDAAEDFVAKRAPVFSSASIPPYERGGIIGVVDLVDVVRACDSPWFVGPVGWVLRNARPLPFMAMKGRLGLFEAPAPLCLPST